MEIIILTAMETETPRDGEIGIPKVMGEEIFWDGAIDILAAERRTMNESPLDLGILYDGDASGEEYEDSCGWGDGDADGFGYEYCYGWGDGDAWGEEYEDSCGCGT